MARYSRPVDQLEVARFQWLEGERRLAAAGSERRACEAVTDKIVAELRRRLGGPFLAEELADLYSEGTDWCLMLAMAAEPNEPRAWDAATVVDAAFGRYLREAGDYAGGRIVAPGDSEKD